MSNTTPPPALYGTLPLQKQSFIFTNIITKDTKDIELYPDDTNLTVLNKLSVKLNILTNEICAYVNDYKLIGFSYDNINIKQIFNKNKIDLDNCLDENFVDKIGNKINVDKNNLMNELFEENFTSWPPADNINYFTLNDLLKKNKKLNPYMDPKFLYSVIYKYFPNIKKDYIDNYSNKSNSDLRKKHIKKIKKLLSSNNHYLDILDNNVDNLLNEQKFTSKLLNFKCINIENNINIIKLFSDYELSSERFYTKLILEDYNNSFFKLYKPELKLPLSTDKDKLDKDICSKLLNDFSDNVSLPYEFKYMPPSIQPRNCLIFKTKLKLKEINLFYSFILFMNGNYDFIINNYNDIKIDDVVLKKIEQDINNLIEDINRPRIYTINEIPRLKKYDDKIYFINTEIVFSMDNFYYRLGESIYDKSIILKYLSNFYTHIRIVKEKMDMDLDPDTIILKYKRVSNYENTDTIQSIINVLHDPNIDIPLEEFIEMISKNIGISVDVATQEHQKWSEDNEKNEFKKKSFKTTEAGAEIRINNLNEHINFQIYNVQSRNELNRIIQFIKIFMKLYEQFIKKELKNKKLERLFTEEDYKKEIEDIQEEQQLFQFIEDPIPSDIHSSQVTNDQDEDLVDTPTTESSSAPDELTDESTSSTGGGKIRKIGKGGYDLFDKLKNKDPKLFGNQSLGYASACAPNLFNVPVPLSDIELERIKKYDIFKTVRIEGIPLTQEEIWSDKYMTNNAYGKADNLKTILKNKGIYSSDEFPSFSQNISQTKIGDQKENINYICPKYWDISKRVSIHPRDIYDRLDDIIPEPGPGRFKGNTDKTIISINHSSWGPVTDDKIMERKLKFIKHLEVYYILEGKIKPGYMKKLEKGLEDSMKIKKIKEVDFEKQLQYIKDSGSPLDRKVMVKFNEQKDKIYAREDTKLKELSPELLNDHIFKKAHPEHRKYIDLLHQQIVKYIQPRFLPPKKNVDGFLAPCCGAYKADYKVGVYKPAVLDKKNIRIADLTPSNINKFAHIHPHLQTLFGFKKEFHDNKRHLGGFIKFGVQQNNNSLINVLSNLYFKENKTVANFLSPGPIPLPSDIAKYRTKYRLGIYFNKWRLAVPDFKTKILIKSLTDENSLLTFMKCGDGNIVQLFKSSSYNINDIEYFVDYIADEKNTINQLKKININNKDYKKIKNDFEEYGIRLMKEKGQSGFDKYGYINEFNDKIYNSDINIKFIYDLIISKNNFIEYLNSNEIKDYKYILPLMSEIKNDHIYILFENNDDSINIRLPLNTYDIYNDKCIFNFIYKVGDIYEPIYYFNNIKPMANGNMECDIEKNMHSYGKINEYIGNILDSISKIIQEIYRKKIEDIEIFGLDDLIKVIKQSDDEPDKLLVDPYCKVSHVITKNNCIFPIIPSGIIDGYELIYSFDNKPSFKKYLEYRKKKVVLKKDKPGVKIYMEKLSIKGFILNDKNKIINIVFKNNTYIPIEEEEYNPKTKNMKYPILGYKDLFIIDKDLQNFSKETDERYLYNTDNDYLNYITNLTIQTIIYYIKNNYKSNDYFTYTTKFEEKSEYTFKLIPKIINKKIVNIVEENTDLIDYFYDHNKFKGTITKKDDPIKDNPLSKLIIKKSLLNELYLIINNNIKINLDIQTDLYEFINEFIKEIIIELPDDEYEKYKNNTDISICSESNDKCLYPCFTDIKDNNECKLYVKKSDIYDKDKSLINKIIYKFIDLLLIHKNIDKISSILQNNININDLYKTAKNNEIFFNYIQHQNKYINELFKSESSFIRNINFYDRENTYLNQSVKAKPIKSIIKGVPNIIKKIFPHSNVLTYIDENNLDFQSLEYSFSEINKEEISSDKLKDDICTKLDRFYKKYDKDGKIIKSYYSRYDKHFELINIDDIKDNINKTNYKINPFDLEILSQTYNDIGFLLISSKYSNQDPSKLKHNILLKYNYKKKNKDTKFILLYHFLNEDNEYDLSNIVFKTNGLEDDDQYKSYLSLEKLLEIPMIKTIIENDYPDLI